MEIKDGYEYYEYYIGSANSPATLYYRFKDGLLETSDDMHYGTWWVVNDHSFFNQYVKPGDNW
jgi:hypothetical protein